MFKTPFQLNLSIKQSTIRLISTIILVLTIVNSSFAQYVHVQLTVKFIDSYAETVFFSEYKNDGFQLIDSVTLRNSVATIKSKNSTFKPGYYKVSVENPNKGRQSQGSMKSFLIYLHKENVEVLSKSTDMTKELRILNGDEASTIQLIAKTEADFKQRLKETLNLVWDNSTIPPQEVEKLQNEHDRNITELDKLITEKSKNKDKTFQAILKLYRGVPMQISPTTKITLETARKSFPEIYASNNTAVLRSPLFKTRIREYNSLFYDRALSFSEQQKNLQKVIPGILKMTAGNKQLQYQGMSILANLFRRNGFDESLLAIDRLYLSKVKDSTLKNSPLAKMIEPYKKTAVGEKAPNIKMNDLDNRPFNLYSRNKNYSVIVFYSSGCSHCQIEMPKLKAWYNRNKGIDMDFLAFSLDTKKTEWINFVEKQGLPFIHLSDLKSWDSPVAEAYNVHGTPSIFILDKQKNIKSKVISVEELDDFFKE